MRSCVPTFSKIDSRIQISSLKCAEHCTNASIGVHTSGGGMVTFVIVIIVIDSLFTKLQLEFSHHDSR